jgi:hypothetical protein
VSLPDGLQRATLGQLESPVERHLFVCERRCISLSFALPWRDARRH